MNVWQRACQIIPGGNCVVSKRPTRYCPSSYPSHYTWAHDNQVTSVEGITYYDYSTMGIGTCILGYGNAEVDAAVIQAIAGGNMSSLNPVEELELAEEMLKINPHMDMCRFARTGGEACAIAARICQVYNPGTFHLQHGYSGWHLGNPEKGFGYNFETMDDICLLKNIYDEISFVIMEPVRNFPDKSCHLMKQVRKWCTENNVPLIFDEITSGFRCNIGGYHAIKGVYPDIAVYGKALGNGYPIACVVGKRELMEKAEDTFISSTFWSERTGYAAALATLEQMKKQHVPDRLIRMGKEVQDGWLHLADLADIDIEVTGIPPLAHFAFKENNNECMTMYTQEMLKRGILATDQFYASIAHRPIDIETYMFHVDKIFTMIAEGKVKLEGEVKDMGWRRPN